VYDDDDDLSRRVIFLSIFVLSGARLIPLKRHSNLIYDTLSGFIDKLYYIFPKNYKNVARKEMIITTDNNIKNHRYKLQLNAINHSL